MPSSNLEYTYYPGCSLHATSRSYDTSTKATMRALNAKLTELADWNCCGATAYMAIKETTALAVSARNLALAEKEGRDVVCPCSGCFVGLSKANTYINESANIRQIVNESLSAGNLSYSGKTKVRHLLDIFVNDIGLESIKKRVTKPLKGLKVACYYGCQIVRPKNNFDDPENPVHLERLMEAIGATTTYFPMKVWCCGGSLMGTEQNIGLRLTKNLLACASRSGANIIVTTCPLCQTNLGDYRKMVNKIYKTNFNIPVLFFTQVVGTSFGIEKKKLGIARSIKI